MKKLTVLGGKGGEPTVFCFVFCMRSIGRPIPTRFYNAVIGQKKQNCIFSPACCAGGKNCYSSARQPGPASTSKVSPSWTTHRRMNWAKKSGVCPERASPLSQHDILAHRRTRLGGRTDGRGLLLRGHTRARARRVRSEFTSNIYRRCPPGARNQRGEEK